MPGGSTSLPVTGTTISTVTFGIPVALDAQQIVETPWADYSSSFAIQAAANPTKGNRTYSARFKYLTAHTIMAAVSIVIGSSYVAGSGAPYFFTLPIPPADSEGFGVMGSGFMTVGSTEYVAMARITTSRMVLYVPAQTGTTTNGTVIKGVQVGSTFGFGTGSVIKMSTIYEV